MVSHIKLVSFQSRHVDLLTANNKSAIFCIHGLKNYIEPSDIDLEPGIYIKYVVRHINTVYWQGIHWCWQTGVLGSLGPLLFWYTTTVFNCDESFMPTLCSSHSLCTRICQIYIHIPICSFISSGGSYYASLPIAISIIQTGILFPTVSILHFNSSR